MADDLTKRRPQDATKVNIHEPWEVRYWTQHFGCSEVQLKAAVNAVGVRVVDVGRHLKSIHR